MRAFLCLAEKRFMLVILIVIARNELDDKVI